MHPILFYQRKYNVHELLLLYNICIERRKEAFEKQISKKCHQNFKTKKIKQKHKLTL